MPHKPGPKTEPGLVDLRPSACTLDDRTRRMAKALGGGNLSRGLRVAAAYAYEAYQHGRFTPDTLTDEPRVR